jgi:hypothetical protein
LRLGSSMTLSRGATMVETALLTIAIMAAVAVGYRALGGGTHTASTHAGVVLADADGLDVLEQKKAERRLPRLTK